MKKKEQPQKEEVKETKEQPPKKKRTSKPKSWKQTKTDEALRKQNLDGSSQSIKRTIESGTPKEKAIMALSALDISNFFGGKPFMEKEDMAALKASLTLGSKEDREEFMGYVREFDKINSLSTRIKYGFKMYQLEATILAQLVTKWIDYNRAAQQRTEIYRALRSATFWYGEERKDEKPLLDSEEDRKELRDDILSEPLSSYHTKKDEEDIEEQRKNIILGILDTSKNEGEAVLRYDEATDTFFADIDGEKGLRNAIDKQIKETKDYLSYFKGSIAAVEDYLEETDFPLMPIAIETCLDNAKEERYIRSLIKDKRFFRSEYNYKKIDKGEPVTEEEERTAVFPDYYEVTPDEDSYKNIINSLRKSKK